MSDNLAACYVDKRKWYQRIVCYRKGDKYNNSQISVHLPLLRIGTMDNFSFSVEFSVDFDGAMLCFSLPYLRFWIGHKGWKNHRILRRLTEIEKERGY